MDVLINVQKSAAQNASDYFDKAKKLKKKVIGTRKAISDIKKRIEGEKTISVKQSHPKIRNIDRKQAWFEKFRWFFTSSGLLVIGGRDTHSNDIVVKQHTKTTDYVFHTEMPGSPFCVIQAEGKTVDKQSLVETAQFCATQSRAWRMKRNPCEVMCVKGNQLHKRGGMKAGSFAVTGKRQLYKPTLELAVGVTPDFLVMCGPLSAVKDKSKYICQLVLGDNKKEDVAKQVRNMIEKKMKLRFSIDTLLRVLPPGDSLIKQ
ncbi:hypothetical protein CL622_03410 [archaeon]|nr:hypothetical protein [archaeon]|tara:strand:+ start:2619 stop:3398 length:780 start_codon:yes stop_codon:yes gene_type:complete